MNPRSILSAILSLTMVLLLGIFQACQDSEKVSTGTKNLSDLEAIGYPIHPVDIRRVRLNDSFWLPMIARVQEKTIAFAIRKCEEEGRLENFLIAGGQLEGPVRGEMPFDDTDVYKIIEGASNSLITRPDPSLAALLDSLIAVIKIGQEEDGYLTTWRTIDPGAPPAEWVKVENPQRFLNGFARVV